MEAEHQSAQEEISAARAQLERERRQLEDAIAAERADFEAQRLQIEDALAVERADLQALRQSIDADKELLARQFLQLEQSAEQSPGPAPASGDPSQPADELVRSTNPPTSVAQRQADAIFREAPASVVPSTSSAAGLSPSPFATPPAAASPSPFATPPAAASPSPFVTPPAAASPSPLATSSPPAIDDPTLEQRLADIDSREEALDEWEASVAEARQTGSLSDEEIAQAQEELTREREELAKLRDELQARA
jgi:hypothetical protein